MSGNATLFELDKIGYLESMQLSREVIIFVKIFLVYSISVIGLIWSNCPENTGFFEIGYI